MGEGVGERKERREGREDMGRARGVEWGMGRWTVERRAWTRRDVAGGGGGAKEPGEQQLVPAQRGEKTRRGAAKGDGTCCIRWSPS
jgi:hypothetical protein